MIFKALPLMLIASIWLFKSRRYKILFISTLFLIILLIARGVIYIETLANIIDLSCYPFMLLISQSIIGYILFRIGFFKWAAHTIVFTAEESEVKLLLHILVFSLILTILTNVYISTIITIIMIDEISKGVELDRTKTIKFVLYSTLVIDISSLMAPSSSLNSLIYMSSTGIMYNSFISNLMLPGLITVALLLLLIYKINKNKLANFTNTNIVNPDIYVSDWKLLNICLLFVFGTQILYFCVGSNNISFYLMPLIFSCLLLFFMFKKGKYSTEKIDIKECISTLVIIGVIYFIISGLLSGDFYFNSFAFANQYYEEPKKLFLISVFLKSTLVSSIIGSIPGSYLYTECFRILGKIIKSNEDVVYLTLIGNTIGGRLLYFGAMNNIIAKKLLARKGLNLGLMEYYKTITWMDIFSGVVVLLSVLIIF